MARVLITGANGFIGRHTIQPLLDQGHEVIGVSRSPASLPKEITVVQADLLDREDLARVFKETKPDKLLHFAWYLEPGKYPHSFLNKAWVEASLEIYRQFAKNGGKRAVLAGTCFEYALNTAQKLDEDTATLNPNTYYGQCKNELRGRLDQLSAELNVPFAWGRIFYLYGPHEYDRRLVASVIKKLIENEEAPCSEGLQIRDFLHVQDVANAFCSLLDSSIEGAVNITSGQGYSIREVVKTIADITGGLERVKFGAFTPRPGDPPEVVGVAGKIKQLEWAPAFDLESGLRQTIQWWKDQP